MAETTTRPLVSLTPAAVAHVKGLLEKQGKTGHGLRIQVVGGGCSGLTYKMTLEEVPAAGDRILDADGLPVFVDLKSALFVAGVTVDWSDDLMDAGWKFQNPNATQSCGCGTSFSA